MRDADGLRMIADRFRSRETRPVVLVRDVLDVLPSHDELLHGLDDHDRQEVRRALGLYPAEADFWGQMRMIHFLGLRRVGVRRRHASEAAMRLTRRGALVGVRVLGGSDELVADVLAPADLGEGEEQQGDLEGLDEVAEFLNSRERG